MTRPAHHRPASAPTGYRRPAHDRDRGAAAVRAQAEPAPRARIPLYSYLPGPAAVRRTARHHPIKFGTVTVDGEETAPEVLTTGPKGTAATLWDTHGPER
ncbi:hypothetical protein OG909_26425 [Streptomyces sp. NBC_01754]|uniref:hypothetical protein n=1 Tax=Streptomyces sp. NBC_01754 TaxID=2975930 RepID=UPI002DDA98B7|nr:hypothetical protein [Streptomyces sp. NBC_01754]WSC95540.1 hypothetical protein OG909_26425 [Streptomyces sp. NBC_01754]